MANRLRSSSGAHDGTTEAISFDDASGGVALDDLGAGDLGRDGDPETFEDAERSAIPTRSRSRSFAAITEDADFG